jgi:predicted regulator of amino acid metabolism with ACT domain
MNISEATRKALSKYPYLDQYMAMRVVNYRGLARKILPEISREVGLTPNVLSIVTALRRTTRKRKPEKSELEGILAKSNVNLKYDMAAATVTLGRNDMRGVKEKLLKEGTYILLQGMESLTVIADDLIIKKVREHLGSEVLEIYSNLAIVVVKSPKEITKTPGVIAYLANILAIEKINVVEMMSSHAETAFIVEERDALRTIEVLRREIKRSRPIPK